MTPPDTAARPPRRFPTRLTLPQRAPPGPKQPHGASKPHVCAVCERRFVSAFALGRHCEDKGH